MIYSLTKVKNTLNDDLAGFNILYDKTHYDTCIILDENICNVLDLAGVEPDYKLMLSVVFPSVYVHADLDDLLFIIRDKKLKELLEHYISKDAQTSYSYARNVTKKPFKLGEAVISKSSDLSLLYAIDVLRDLFPEGEDSIRKNRDKYELYVSVMRSLGKLGG